MLYQDNCRGNCYTREFPHLKCISLDVQYKNIIYFHLKMNQWEIKKKRRSTESCWEHALGGGKGNKELGNVQSYILLERDFLLI